MFELFRLEVPGLVENGALQVFVEADTAFLKRLNRFFMAGLELVLVEMKALNGYTALLVVPCVGEKYASDVPK